MTDEVAIPVKTSVPTPEESGVKLRIWKADHRDGNPDSLPHLGSLTRFEVWYRSVTSSGKTKWEPLSQWGTERDARERIEEHAHRVLPMLSYSATFEYAIVISRAQRELLEDSLVVATKANDPASKPISQPS